MKKPYIRSGLSRIRTHTTRKSSDNTPRHELLMQLTSLEIEMSRRTTERAASMKRVESIDERLAAITQEQQSIRDLLRLAEFQKEDSVEKTSNRSVNAKRQDDHARGVFEY
jgi:hypothetical protein